MKKILPSTLAITLLAVTTAYLTPLYPVYAQSTPPGNAQGPTPPDTPNRGPKQLPPMFPMQIGSQSGTMTPPGLERALTRVKNATAEAKLKQALARFKDKNKASRVERINTRLNDINTRHTDHMNDVLSKISDILERLKNKASTATSAEIDTAIAEVEGQWAEASAAVEAQALKDYSINLNTEATAASDAASIKNTLQSDLRATHTQVVETRQALANAISTIMSTLKGGDNGSE